MRVRVDVDFLVIAVAKTLERLLADAGPGDGGAEKADDGGALRASEARIAARDDIGRDPALPVCWACQCDEAPFSGDEILDLDGVAHGEDVQIAGAHLVIHADAAARADFKPRRLGKRGVRTHADSENHQIGPMGLAGFRPHIDHAVSGILECGHPVA